MMKTIVGTVAKRWILESASAGIGAPTERGKGSQPSRIAHVPATRALPGRQPFAKNALDGGTLRIHGSGPGISPFDPSRRPEFLRARAHFHFGEVGRSQQRDVSPTRQSSRLRRYSKKYAPGGRSHCRVGGPEGNRTPDLFHAKEAR